MPAILLARHGQGSFGSDDYDVLSALGRAQSERLAADLARRGVRLDRVVSGTLARQRDTAAPFGHPVTADARWNEYAADDILAHHSGSPVRLEHPQEGERAAMTTREFQPLLEGALLAWIAAGTDSPAPESWPAFAARATAALEAVQAACAGGETALVATSGGVIATICAGLLGAGAAAFVALNRVTVNTGVTKIVHGRGGTTLVAFNEHAHLEQPGRSLVSYR